MFDSVTIVGIGVWLLLLGLMGWSAVRETRLRATMRKCRNDTASDPHPEKGNKAMIDFFIKFVFRSLALSFLLVVCLVAAFGHIPPVRVSYVSFASLAFVFVWEITSNL